MLKNYWSLYVILLLVVILGIYQYSTTTAEIGLFPEVSEVSQDPTVEYFSLNFVGDIMPARAIELAMRRQGYEYPFRKIQAELSAADITFANMESPLIGNAATGRTTPGGTTVFRGDVDFAQAIKKAGIDVVSLANNHMKDQGVKGIISTIRVLDDAGVQHAGAGQNLSEAQAMARMVIPSKQGGPDLKVGILAYNDRDVVPESYHATADQSGTNIMDIERLKQDIQKNRSEVDVLVVSMHSGTEYSKVANKKQIDFAHTAIDAGADMVIGHHPHVLQPIEVYKGKYIFYSLGNFVFDQPWPDTKQSVLVNMRIRAEHEGSKKWSSIGYFPKVTPLNIYQFQPQTIVPQTTEYQKVMDRFRFPFSFLTIDNTTILVKQATTSASRQQGLSRTDSLSKGQGLLFVFDGAGKHGIWMKDMNYPIDIYWFDSQFKLIDKELNVATSTYPNVFYPDGDALYVLETGVGELPDMSLTKDLTGALTYIQSYDKK